MTENRSQSAFNLASAHKPTKAEPEITRDKDNAQPRVKPPSRAQTPAPRLAPPGMMGTKRNLATRAQLAANKKPVHDFTMGKRGALKQEFKPLVERSIDRGHDIDR